MPTKNMEHISQIECFIDDYQETNGTTPTIREIEAGLGISKSAVGRYLAYMRGLGMIDYKGHRNITTKEGMKTQRESVRVPVLGAVSCGIPKFAEENIEEYVRLPVALFGHGPFFILRANGDSMVNADISDEREEKAIDRTVFTLKYQGGAVFVDGFFLCPKRISDGL